jgi:hypothetical protein
VVAVGLLRRDGFRHRAEVDDVLRQHNGEHDDGDDRDTTQRQRGDGAPPSARHGPDRLDRSARRVRHTIEQKYANSTTAVITQPAMT